MLVLSRKNQESVVVCGSNDSEQLLRVTVLDICGEKVRLGFEADSSFPIHRSEVWERMRAADPTQGIKPRPTGPPQ